MALMDFQTGSTTSAPRLANHSSGDPVVVTPCSGGLLTRSVAMDDIAFASRCEFSWRTEITTTTSPTGKLSFRTFTQTAEFTKTALRRYPSVGDRITRTWDNAIFDIVDVSAHGSDLLICGLRERSRRSSH